MPLSIGVNLRVTGHCNQGGRKYMEDMFSVAFQSTPDDKDLEYAFFGIFDGHGGGEAATFAKEHLMNVIVKQKNFWSDRDEDVLRAIKDGYVNTHYAMWRELDKWPRTASGLPSTAGTTASIAFIRKGKIYLGHVGDSGIILGYQADGDPQWRAEALTKDHKPESGPEMMRIRQSGGKVVSKSGVPRVVWNRPRIGHKGPVRRSTHIDEIPFLAVARSLGDLWSYNSELNTFVVSPEPDVKVVAIDVESHRCLIFGTDGLWNMLTPQAAVAIVQAADRHNEKHLIASQQTCNGQADNVQLWINPSKSLVDRALEKWSLKRLRADNTSVVTLMLDPPGPSRSEIILSQKECVVTHRTMHTPTATLAEAPTRHTCNQVSPSTPRPSPIINHYVDLNRSVPAFSDEIEGNRKESYVDNICTPPDKIEENQYQKDEKHADISENLVNGNVQPVELSSNEILKNSIEVNSLEFEAEVEKTKTNEGQPTKITEDNTLNEQKNSRSSRQSPEIEMKNDPDVSNVIHQSAFSSECNGTHSSTVVTNTTESNEVVLASTSSNENEVKANILNGSRHRQTTLFSTSRRDVRSTRRLSLTTHPRNTLGDASSLETKTYVNSRLKSRSTKVSVSGNTVEEGVRNSTSKTSGSAVATKRRHSAISQSVVNTIEESCMLQEPCVKRRTRSEDRPNPVDENDPANQATKDASSSMSWPSTDSNIARSTAVATTVPVHERLLSLNSFQRNLEKKATPVKAIRRPSFKGLLKQLWAASLSAREWDQGRSNRSNNCNERRIKRAVSIIGPSDNTTVPQRWLRSDTIAATPVKTLRSRNVDITGHTISPQLVHQYGIVKQSRLSLPCKLKHSSNNGFLQSNRVRSSSLSSSIKQTSSNTANGACSTINPTNTGCNSSSGMAKRVKSPYNPSARSLSTRSRIKRLGK
ncbi:protein phosphatase 1D [Bombus bifarius]|uniref:Protein phosphatase 1D n=1 Tax=Bombus bifarius TaxID=103933 RepID=A0A6P8NQ44_9HYME|nr:protein phosphatase 1D [Bombus bifarius]XP_033316397.1 protein phosphatase 1D [Bombus bifarius]XP_033316398.1 protein phosphatase 1D [Bombus bifarius]